MKRPNIICIVTDQQHPDLVGDLGKIPVQTPNLDRLCAEGTAFTRAYTPCPLCTPARASLVTGQYPSTHGAWTIGTALPENALSLPKLLGESGYETAIIGKSHLRPCHDPNSFEALPNIRNWEKFRQWNGPWYGFEKAHICVGHTNEPHAYGMHYGLWLQERGIAPVPPYFADLEDKGNYGAFGTWELPEECHAGVWIAEETERFLKRHVTHGRQRPFYLSLNFPDPHLPFRVSERWHRLYDEVMLPQALRRRGEETDKPTLYQATLDGSLNRLGWNKQFFIPNQYVGQRHSEQWTDDEVQRWRLYLAMTSQLDAHVGRVLDALDKFDLSNNTLVVFTSDHGDYMGHHWLWSKGGSHYDQAVRVPFLVRYPGVVPAGVRSNALQSLVDLPATFLNIAGKSSHPLMEGINQAFCWHDPAYSVRNNVFIDHQVEEGLHVRSLITDTHRLSVHEITAEQREEVELYDFETDPHEFVNRAGRGDAIEVRLREQLKQVSIIRSTPHLPRTAGA